MTSRFLHVSLLLVYLVGSDATSKGSYPNVWEVPFDKSTAGRALGKKEQKCKDPNGPPPSTRLTDLYDYIDCLPSTSPVPAVVVSTTYAPTVASTPPPSAVDVVPTATPTIAVPTVTSTPPPSAATATDTSPPSASPTAPTATETSPPTEMPSENAVPVTSSPSSDLSVNSTTSSPTGSPTLASTSEEQVKACVVASLGGVYETNVSVHVDYYYELLTYASDDITEVATKVNGKVQTLLVDQLMQCNRRRLSRSLSTLGIEQGTTDTVEGGTCSTLEPGDNSQICYVMKGNVTLFLSEDSLLSHDEGSQLIFMELSTEFNSGRRALQSNILDEESGILGVYFIGGTFDSDSIDSTAGEVPARASAATELPSDSQSFSGAGVAFIVVACVGVLAVAILAARAKRNQSRRSKGIQLENDTLDSPDHSRDVENGRALPGKVLTGDDYSLTEIEVNYLRDLTLSESNSEGDCVPPTFISTDLPTPKAYPTRPYVVDNTVDF